MSANCKRRGATFTEALVLIGVVALTLIAAARTLASSIGRSAGEMGDCLGSMKSGCVDRANAAPLPNSQSGPGPRGGGGRPGGGGFNGPPLPPPSHDAAIGGGEGRDANGNLVNAWDRLEIRNDSKYPVVIRVHFNNRPPQRGEKSGYESWVPARLSDPSDPRNNSDDYEEPPPRNAPEGQRAEPVFEQELQPGQRLAWWRRGREEFAVSVYERHGDKLVDVTRKYRTQSQPRTLGGEWPENVHRGFRLAPNPNGKLESIPDPRDPKKDIQAPEMLEKPKPTQQGSVVIRGPL